MADRWKATILTWRPASHPNDVQQVTGYADGSGLAFFNVPCVLRAWRILHVGSGYELSGYVQLRTMKRAQQVTEAVVALDLDFNRSREEFGAVTGNAVHAVFVELGVLKR